MTDAAIVHPARQTRVGRIRKAIDGSIGEAKDMWILVVEALGALGVLLFIAWWTLGPTHRREQAALRDEAARLASGDRAAADRDPRS